MATTPLLNAAVFGASGGIGAALVARLAARDDVAVVHAGSRQPVAASGKLRPFRFDLEAEPSIAAAAAGMDSVDLVIIATGVLTLPEGPGPEKAARDLDGAAMARLFALNTIGPALIARHMLPLLPKSRRAVFAALSARVGSLADNRLGGWHSYRASKAALNMLMRNFAIELARTRPQAMAVALHPGTVQTRLSAPFSRNLAAGQAVPPDTCAANLLRVIDRLTPSDSGCLLAWDGSVIPY